MTRITRAFRRIRDWLLRRHRQEPSLIIAATLWQEVLAELGRRGGDGKRESGAFLLAHRGQKVNCVTRVAYYDDLDPDCLKGYIHFQAVGYSKLWDLCEEDGLRVIADVHTHPSSWVSQSHTDREHPMIARVGHIALIVPSYATRTPEAHEVGVHIYRGDDGWKSLFGPNASKAIKIRGSNERS